MDESNFDIMDTVLYDLMCFFGIDIRKNFYEYFKPISHNLSPTNKRRRIKSFIDINKSSDENETYIIERVNMPNTYAYVIFSDIVPFNECLFSLEFEYSYDNTHKNEFIYSNLKLRVFDYECFNRYHNILINNMHKIVEYEVHTNNVDKFSNYPHNKNGLDVVQNRYKMNDYYDWKIFETCIIPTKKDEVDNRNSKKWACIIENGFEINEYGNLKYDDDLMFLRMKFDV